ncbi:MAG: hypothetical protein JHC93_04425 [Parachlamydiales bacterium]|nr:hypothetical protein [Parachlamydiales bacterium]
MNKDFFVYILVRTLCAPLAFFPLSWIHVLGNGLGSLIFTFDRKRRKRALNNLFITIPFNSFSYKEKCRIAKGGFQNLAITCLEFFRLKRSRGKFEEILTFDNLDVALKAYEQKKGVILFAGHQANWEASFIAITTHIKGVAIGKRLKNRYFHKWIFGLREMHGGKLILPHEAMKVGLQALKDGQCLGFVGDQALPNSSYSYPLFGVRAWTSPAPALLAYRSGSAILPSMIVRDNGKYRVHFEQPIWPDLSKPLKDEVVRMMNQAMALQESNILKHPEQWMWQHNRWKQMPVNHLKKWFRHDFVSIILPKVNFDHFAAQCHALRCIFERSFITVFIPEGKTLNFPEADSLFTYAKEDDLFIDDYKTQLLIDFASVPKLSRHYKKLCCFETIDIKGIHKESHKYKHLHNNDISTELVYAFCKNTDFNKVFKVINAS